MDGSLPSFEERMLYIRSTHELEDQIVELGRASQRGQLSLRPLEYPSLTDYVGAV